jgi:hypothetical protein
MKHIIFTIFFCFISIITFGQSSSKEDLKYKPKTLDEAIVQLEKIHHDTTKQKIIAMTEKEFLGNSHFGLGLWMRNNWGLWKGKELAKHFKSIGVFHPDDMSGIILTSYYRQLKGQDRKLDEQIKNYQEYWKLTYEHFNRIKTDTLYQKQIEKSKTK